MTAEFSLTALIESVEDAGPNAHDMAAKAWPLIPESERDTVGTMLLTRWIANMKPRISTITSAPAHLNGQSAGAKVTAGGQMVRSAKVAAIRAEHARFLRLRVNVARGEDKWMSDCTYDDLCYAAENRRQKAAETVAVAEKYEELAALVKRHKVATVGALPATALDKFLSVERVPA